MKTRIREKNYDLLRGISCVFVVVLHWGCFFCGQNYEDDKYAYLVGYFAQSVSRFAVPCFLMLSGAFVLLDKKIDDVKAFWKKMIKKLVVPILVFSALYVLFSYARLFTGDSEQSVNYFKPLIDWLNGVPYYHMWYAYMLLGLYFIAPFVQMMKKRISKNVYLGIILFAFLVGFLSEYFLNLVWCLQFITYGGYFMLGDYIRNYAKKNQTIHKYKNFMLIGAMFILMVVFGLSYMLKDTYTFYQPMFPLIICASVMMFIWFANTEIQMNAGWIAKNTLYIYILHVGIMDCMNILVIKLLGYPSVLWYFPVGVICTTLLSVLGAYVIEKILQVFNGSTMKKDSNI